jgi:putative acetyltransferase
MKIARTNSDHPDSIKLVKFLDADLAKRSEQNHAFYVQFNNIDEIE